MSRAETWVQTSASPRNPPPLLVQPNVDLGPLYSSIILNLGAYFPGGLRVTESYLNGRILDRWWRRVQ